MRRGFRHIEDCARHGAAVELRLAEYTYNHRGLGRLPVRRHPAGIVRGQRISAAKLTLAKQMRREMTLEDRMLWNQLRGNRRNGLNFRRQQVTQASSWISSLP